MKSRFTTIAALFAIITLVACNGGPGGTETVDVDGKYSITVPSFMSDAEGELNDEASLQYQSILREVYTIIIDEPWDEFKETYLALGMYDTTESLLHNYRNAQMGDIVAGLDITQQSEPKAFEVNGLSAETIQVDGNYEEIDEEISYFFTFIQGPEDVYYVMSWTLKSRKDKYGPVFEEMVKSFRLGNAASPESDEELEPAA